MLTNSAYELLAKMIRAQIFKAKVPQRKSADILCSYACCSIKAKHPLSNKKDYHEPTGPDNVSYLQNFIANFKLEFPVIIILKVGVPFCFCFRYF